MMMNNNCKRNIIVVIFVIILFMGPLLTVLIDNSYQSQLSEMETEKEHVTRYIDHRINSLKKQKYVTISQFKKLAAYVSQHLGYSDPQQKIVDKFDKTHIVDEQDDHEYWLTVKTNGSSLVPKLTYEW